MPAVDSSAELEPWTAQLRALPFVRGVRVQRHGRAEGTAQVVIQTPFGKFDYLVEVGTARQLGPAQLARLEGQAKHSRPARILLFASYIAPAAAERLRGAGIDYLDTAGNCHLSVVPHFLVSVEGRKVRAALRDIDGRAKPRTA